ncbi:MAG TPA: DUF1499 domain-containing protein [Blastocatellia bacterium]|nr:DUF1499 domain-containing protein [Blastocatellia bacterium]
MNIKKVLPGVVAVVALLIVGAGVVGTIWPRINDVETGETPQYPDLQPQYFKEPPYRVYDAALAVARDLGWQQIEEDRGNGEINAVDITLIFRFRDDIKITIKPEGAGTVVNVRSRSRVGKGDFGTNARRIRRFQAELAKRL